jgi:large subunit ribosomal protein L29
MKTKELQEMRENSVAEMNKKVMELKAELFNLRFQLATGQLENPLRIKDVKKSIAQVKTLIKEQELNAVQK